MTESDAPHTVARSAIDDRRATVAAPQLPPAAPPPPPPHKVTVTSTAPDGAVQLRDAPTNTVSRYAYPEPMQ
nr:hypothetical protein BN7_615 [Pandoravirus massiliensis]